MVVERGEVWWADHDEPIGSVAGFRRPVLVVQADAFNRSRIETVIVVALTSNLRLLDAPGNVLVPKKASGLPRDSAANVAQGLTLDRGLLADRAGKLPPAIMTAVGNGLRLVLAL